MLAVFMTCLFIQLHAWFTVYVLRTSLAIWLKKGGVGRQQINAWASSNSSVFSPPSPSRPLPRRNDHHMQNVQIKTIPLRLSGIEFFIL
jgi:hypothetical protein